MKEYAVYKPSGEIISVGQCADVDFDLTASNAPGLVLPLQADSKVAWHSHYVFDGVVRPMPPKPGPNHDFDYTTKQWVDPRTPETEWPLVRQKRNALLTKSDWTQLPDVPIDTKEAWATYRQALRDVTDQPDPFNIVWPVAPGSQS
jgi:hypothetical protein